MCLYLKQKKKKKTCPSTDSASIHHMIIKYKITFHLLAISVLNQSIQKTGFPVTNLPLKTLIWHCPSFELKQKFWSFSTEGNFTSRAIKFSFTPDRASNWVSVSVLFMSLKFMCIVCVRERERAKGRERGGERAERMSISVHSCRPFPATLRVSESIQDLFPGTLGVSHTFVEPHCVCVWVFVRASTHVCYCPNSPFP